MSPSAVTEYQMVIGGQSVPAAGGRTLDSVDPATGDTWARIPDATPEDVDRAVAAARAALRDPAWAGLTASARGRLLTDLAALVDEEADALARIETRDNGKLLREMSAQAHALGRWYRYFGGLADKIEGSVPPIDFPSVMNFTVREPVGVVAAIAPWNSPLLLATWKLAPALAAGNTVVAKPSEYTSASLIELARLFERAGFPPGVLNVITGDGRRRGRRATGHPGIDHIAFTGGPESARAIGRAAADRLTPATYELGGKSANVVFEDAQLDAAEAGVLAGIFAASGQTCIAGSRLLVQRSIAEDFSARIVARTEAIRLGDPTAPETQMGPARHGPAARADRRRGAAGGRRGRHAGGGRPHPRRPGARPRALLRADGPHGVTPDSEIAQTEVFGPVLAVIPFEDEADAVRIANSTPYALAAGVWTRDVKRAHRMARALDAGTIWVNTYRAVSPLSPFGGSGLSGFGRENGMEAITAFTKTKSVWIELSEDVQDPFVLRV